jgi:transcriptional regulator with XRE-family HTH domain
MTQRRQGALVSAQVDESPATTGPEISDQFRPTFNAAERPIRVGRTGGRSRFKPGNQSPVEAARQFKEYADWLERRVTWQRRRADDLFRTSDALARQIAYQENQINAQREEKKRNDMLLGSAGNNVKWEVSGEALPAKLSQTISISDLLDAFANLAKVDDSALQPRPRRQTEAPHLAALSWIKHATGMADAQVADLVGITRQTIHNWRRGVPIKASNRERVLAVRDVLERSADRVGTGDALAAWLQSPCAANGRSPFDLLAAGEVDRARTFAVSKLPARLVIQPRWIRPEAQRAPLSDPGAALPPWYDDNVLESDEDTGTAGERHD